MMQGYLKENDISIKSGNDVNFIMRDMMWIFLLRETLIPEMWKPVFRNTETVLIGLMDIYRVQLICQAQSRFAVRSRLYDWVETDKLVLLQSHTFLGSLMPDSMDMVAGIFIMSVLLEGALDEELNEELGYSKYDYRNQETDNSRNGHSKKTLQRVPKESASMCMSRRMKNTQYLTWKCRQPLREMVDWHYIYSNEAWISLSDSHYRLVQSLYRWLGCWWHSGYHYGYQCM